LERAHRGIGWHRLLLAVGIAIVVFGKRILQLNVGERSGRLKAHQDVCLLLPHETPRRRATPAEHLCPQGGDVARPAGTLSPATESWEVLSAERALVLATRSCNQPKAIERISVSAAVKGFASPGYFRP